MHIFAFLGLVLSVICVKNRNSRSGINIISIVISSLWIVLMCSIAVFHKSSIIFFFGNRLCFIFCFHSIRSISFLIKLPINSFCQFHDAGFLNLKMVHSVAGSRIDACFPVPSSYTCGVTSKTGRGAFVSIITKSSLSSRPPMVSPFLLYTYFSDSFFPVLGSITYEQYHSERTCNRRGYH